MHASRALIALVLASTVSLVALADGPQGRPPFRGPPKEAIDACQNLSDGAECTVSIHGDTLKGTCHAPPGKQLACLPKGPPPPPPEAVDACADLKADDACSFSLGEETLSGTCHAPSGKPLACVPKGFPPPPGE